MEKFKELLKYSDPEKVQRNADLYGIGTVYLSPRKNKKYMVLSPDGQYIHFGYMGMEDFTKHRNKKRRDNFRERNRLWKDAEVYTPRFLSYWLLW